MSTVISSPNRPAPAGSIDRHAGLVLAVIVCSQLMIGVDATIVNVALPKIQAALHFRLADLSWVLNAYTLVFGGLLLLGGRAGDIFGRRRVFVTGIAVFTAASLAGGLAQSAGWLLAARAVQGIGAALAAPSTFALIATNFAEGRERNRALSVLSSVTSAGASLGLILGGVITSVASWRWGLFVNVPVGILVTVLALRFIREPERHTGRLDVAGAGTATTGMFLIVYGLIRAASSGWSDGLVLGALGAGVALLIGFGFLEARVGTPLVPLSLFRDRNRAAAYVSVMLLGAGIYGPFFFLTEFFQNVHRLGPLWTGLAFLPLTGGLFAMARFAPRLIARLGVRPLITIGAVVLIGATVLLTRVGADTPYVTGVFGPLLLMGLGGGCVFVPMYTLILARVAPGEAGAASGVLQTLQWLGGTFCLALLVSVASTADSFVGGMTRAFLTTAALTVCALGVVTFAVRTPVAQPTRA
jgi:EmrB/QacA subfamily drug resistance transporter